MTKGAKRQAFEVRNRDIRILKALFEHRFLTRRHLATLFFEGSAEATKKRLQKLLRPGLIRESQRRVNERGILFLTQEGLRTLKQHDSLEDLPSISQRKLAKRSDRSEATLRHELDIIDVKVAFVHALSATTILNVAEFSTWAALHQFRAFRPRVKDSRRTLATVKPDSFIRIHEKSADSTIEHAFFLELDRSTETLDTLVLKASCYRDYYRRGGFALKWGGRAEEFEEFPFRVLFVCKSAARGWNILRKLLDMSPPVRTQVWVTTLKEATRDPLGAIWRQPADLDDPRAAAHRLFSAVDLSAPLEASRLTDTSDL